MLFPRINTLQELIKSYTIAQAYSPTKAKALREQINAIRLEIAIDAEMREIFYAQQLVPPLTNAAFAQSIWFTKDDIRYIIKRGVARLTANATVSVVNQGNRQRIITREPIAWQQFFSDIQNAPPALGQQTLFDLPQELEFTENEALGIQIQGQVANDGYLFYHGCTLKDNLDEARVSDINAEIESYIPEGAQIVPILFQFTAAAAGNPAVNAAGGADILSAKNSRSVVLTHFSTSAQECRFTLQDTGRNQLICQDIEMRGVAAGATNQFTTWYELPFPHLLRRGDRLKLQAINGSVITGNNTAANTVQYFAAKGYPV
jgi:hypothetical protein